VYTVRRARPEDLPAIDRVDSRFEEHSHTEFIARAVSEGRVVVAEDGETIVGYVQWEPFWDTIPYCNTARILPEHQRRGLGRRLYELLEETFRADGRPFWLSSTEETNERSQRFHEALGFRPIGSLLELDQDVPEIFYRKDL
jgi:ribosomal protein S18 acetylase RimI-like enzyme